MPAPSYTITRADRMLVCIAALDSQAERLMDLAAAARAIHAPEGEIVAAIHTAREIANDMRLMVEAWKEGQAE